ncbi:MAG: DUF1801 domain-containing protein [Bacteroidetes bacterium]|nr:DUF1801 domain-containing protein [Bacteroidota bacterium]
MKISNDIKTQNFIDHIKVLDSTKHQILERLRAMVFDNHPKVRERMMYGGIIFSLTDDFGGVFVYKNHVSFEFGYGYKLSDPEKLLEGGGKYRRHLKIRSMDDIEMKKFDFFIKQIQEFEK